MPVYYHMEVISSLHESLNFKLPPRKRECFYENFVLEAPTRTIEIFAYSIGEHDVTFTAHGPLEYKDILNVLSLSHISSIYLILAV